MEEMSIMITDDIKQLFLDLSSKLLSEEKLFQAPNIRIDEEIERARQEWIKAQKYFECVTEPDLIDHAIFVEEAALRKYTYLLKKARDMGINSGKAK
jgi:hypothetical protein